MNGKALELSESGRAQALDSILESDLSKDGHLFVGVSSTKIYCRPTCHVTRPPLLKNCTFYASGYAAERAGYRPCLICRTELAPLPRRKGLDNNLASRVVALARELCCEQIDITFAAQELSCEKIDIENALDEEYGTDFEHLVLACRLQTAKMLLTDTALDSSEISQAVCIGSALELDSLLKSHYKRETGDFRKKRALAADDGCFALRLDYRPPLRFDLLLKFFGLRVLEGVELVTDDSYLRTVSIRSLDGIVYSGWIRVAHDEKRRRVVLNVSKGLLPVISHVVARVRRLFDLDAEPQVVFDALEQLESLVPGADVLGTRVPGSFNAFEIAVRAVLGQQVSVKAANKLAAKIAKSFGTSVKTPYEQLGLAFPDAEVFAGLNPISDFLGPLGVIKTRSATIQELAKLTLGGDLKFCAWADLNVQMERLLQVKGIGVWSQNYIAMRSLSYTDAFLEKDSGIKHALPDIEPQQRLEAVEPCRPWRSYANLCLWNSLSGD